MRKDGAALALSCVVNGFDAAPGGLSLPGTAD
jgi:hypothetical protein